MPIYRLQRRLSHADVDFLGELKVPALLGLLEQAAVEASTAAGFDAARYTREGRIWIIRRTRLQRLVPVGGGDTVEVETRVADFRRARSLRRYTVRRHGEVVAEATTDWVYCDLQTGRPVRVPEALQSAFMGGADTEALPRAESLPAGAPGVPAEFTLTVQPSHLDHVGHVNNAVYASYLEDGAFVLFALHGWPLARMLSAGGALRIRRLDAEYRRDAEAGELLTVRSWLLGPAVGVRSAGPLLSFEAPHDRDRSLTAATADRLSGDTGLAEDAAVVPERASMLQVIARADGTEIMRAQSDWLWGRKPFVVGGVPPG